MPGTLRCTADRSFPLLLLFTAGRVVPDCVLRCMVPLLFRLVVRCTADLEFVFLWVADDRTAPDWRPLVATADLVLVEIFADRCTPCRVLMAPDLLAVRPDATAE